MVDRVFGDRARHLIAVWDRTYFGLTPKQYHAKTPTVKDLRRPWISLPEPYSHSRRTTLLLDDSVDKAQQQPNNHICLTEYTAARRKLDCQTRLRVLQHSTMDIADPSYDSILLAMVGIIEAARNQPDVAKWLATGGLRKIDTQHNPISEYNATKGNQSTPLNDVSGLWFDDPDVLRFWTRRGQETLSKLDIPIIPGVVL